MKPTKSCILTLFLLFAALVAAGDQCERHCERKNECKNFLHIHILLTFCRAAAASGASAPLVAVYFIEPLNGFQASNLSEFSVVSGRFSMAVFKFHVHLSTYRGLKSIY